MVRTDPQARPSASPLSEHQIFVKSAEKLSASVK